MRLSLLILGAALSISATDAPHVVPVPEPKPEIDAPQQKQDAQDVPNSVPLPAPAPSPAPAPASAEEGKPSDPSQNKAAPEEVTSATSDSPKCEMELTKLGAKFEPIAPIKDGGGCGIDHPVELRSINEAVKLDAKAVLSCDAALALTQWVQQSIVPNLKLAFPDKELASLSNASSYVCRNRNHAKGGKISEHAKGNAFDIASLTFSDKSQLIMKPRGEDGTLEGAFQRTITTSACLFFRTVLSPGSDATHQNHLHLDVMQRNNDFRYCR